MGESLSTSRKVLGRLPGQYRGPVSSVRPTSSAWACAMALMTRLFWWLASVLPPSRAAMNSTGITSRPWWIIWKNACWPLVPGSPQTTGEVEYGNTWLCTSMPLPLLSISSCCR
ncbi:hypothetical protein D3C71_1633230 [compost metagenome]